MTPPASPPRRRWLAPALAAAGVVLLFGALVASFGYMTRTPPPHVDALIMVGIVLGFGLQLFAVGLSVLGALRHGWRPVVALLYGALGLVALGSYGYERYQERAWYEDGNYSVETSPDRREIDVRTADGVWTVSLDACPAPARPASPYGPEYGTRQHGDTVSVTTGGLEPYMRLLIAERRTECVPA